MKDLPHYSFYRSRFFLHPIAWLFFRPTVEEEPVFNHRVR